MNRSLTVDVQWLTPGFQKTFYLISLHEWNFLFLIGAFVGRIAVELLMHVKEVGEVEKELVKKIMRTSVKDFFVIGILIGWHECLWEIIKRRLPLSAMSARMQAGNEGLLPEVMRWPLPDVRPKSGAFTRDYGSLF
ncbi:MAG TPA: hypothetical protein VF490_16770 [Chryseosolibacter sp.]